MPDAIELNTTETADATLLAETMFGDGIQVVSATLTGAASQAGTYEGGEATSGGVVPSDSGVILSTGNIADFTNGGGGTDTNTSAGTSTGHGGAGDSDLDGISTVPTNDAVVFESAFIPDDDYITMQLVFSSEEYLEYVNLGVNDTLGVWVNGEFVPLTSSGDTVSIDTVNDSSNSNLYIDNPQSADTYNTEMDGFTVTLSFKAPVNAGEENTIKIGLGDGGDDVWDSNVLIAADSVQTVALAFEDEVTLEANTTAVLDVLANDHDASGDGLTVTEINGQAVLPGESVTLNTGETVTLNADHTLNVETDSDLGETVFTYTVENSDGVSDVGYVKVETVNDAPLNGIVEGSGGGDVIDTNFTDDPQGDMIDSGDATGVNGTVGDDDYVLAHGGDDTVHAGLGDDIVDGGSGDDVIYGGAGSDTLEGGAGNDTIHGGNVDGPGTPQQIDIVNASFEETDHSDGSYTTGVPGWTIDSSGSGSAGDYDPTDSQLDPAQVDGENVGWLDHGGSSSSTVSMSQTLSQTYTAGDSYTFSADIGDGAYTGSGDEAYEFNIYAGSTLIGTTSGTTGDIDALTTVSVDTTVDDPALDGQPITIEFVRPAGSAGGEVLIDNVTGTVTPSAPPDDMSGDLIDGGSGADVIYGDGGDDTIALTDGFGNDTITGGETGETDGDTLDMSGVGAGVQLDLTSTDPEAGAVFENGTTGGSAQFTEIENIVLSAGRDTVHLADGGGQDAVAGFDITDFGDGTALDQLDVSKLTSDGGTTPVTTADVEVMSDPYGSAVLVFPGGESITLEGVNPLNLSTVDELVAIGIPDGRNYIVEGTSDADLIDAGYTDDPEGDMVDGGDALDGSDDDVIEAGAGDDTVLAGAGDDSVRGGMGDDWIEGGDGVDSLYGDEGNDTILGGAGNDTLDGYTGADSLVGGDGDDWINGHDGDDTLVGGAGDDWLRGSVGNDELWGGTGDDYLWGGYGDDTFRVEDDFGNDTIEGENIDEVTGDVLDLSLVTDGLTVDLTGSNPENGTFTDGTHTAKFDDIENIVLGGGNDTVVLADLGGADSVQGFDLGDDDGDGLTNDQLDVSGVTSDWGTTPVTAWDVTVTDTNGDGTGDAILTFPGGESITLEGVTPDKVNEIPELHAIGIPCFTPGALIVTIDGEKPVEDIHPGDMVLTADNGFQPVRWVGRRCIGAAELAERPELKPYVIRKHAFGNARKMRVSPQHGFVMKTDTGERLIRAKHAAALFGGQIARRDKTCEAVTYIHILFDRHEIVFAEGARTEAFYPGPQALRSIDRAAATELLTLFPELAPVALGGAPCAEGYGPPARDYLKGRDIRAMAKNGSGCTV
ncbi:choice-of-anchor L domain-containing protein [Nioella halotolerans]|uniref:choice-of-anchor L domain-containing protein n=1 Tax=Nioella halotolerans TaxID=2303578 RepID=UPI002683778C